LIVLLFKLLLMPLFFVGAVVVAAVLSFTLTVVDFSLD
jgi:hypothetical protein